MVHCQKLFSASGYYLFSRHRKGHGIHSPFVFSFINNILRRDIPPGAKENAILFRRRMLSRNERIEVNDLGTGSGRYSAKGKRLSGIFRRSSISNKYGRVLYNLAVMYNGCNILEMGTSTGMSVLYLALGAPDSKIISIEGCENLSGIARLNLKYHGIKNVKVLTGDFEDRLQHISETDFRPSLVFVDGNHRKEPVLKYFSILKELIIPGSVIIFDDIDYSVEMNRAWNEIKRDPQVSVSIDILRMGLVFTVDGIVKQDFRIRY